MQAPRPLLCNFAPAEGVDTEEAKLHLEVAGQLYPCDGAQRVDVLCVGVNGVAAAFELKLGVHGLSASEFAKRFCSGCTIIENRRIKGRMVSVLARKVDGIDARPLLRASNGKMSWEVAKSWWLVMRKTIWERHYKNAHLSPLEHATVILVEDLVEIYGGQGPFNALVCSLLSRDPYSAWQLKA